jgi:hypothetical protein
MQFLKTISCLLLMSVFVQYTCAQTGLQRVVSPTNGILFNTTQFIKTDSGVIINRYYKAGCKNYLVNTELVNDSIIIPLQFVPGVYKELPSQKLITVHGNVLYNFYYRSQIDTPFAENNVMQHLVQTNLNVLIKDKYPLRVIISNRNSNSAYFKNATDINVQFNRSYFLENIKTNLKEKAISMVKTGALGITEQQYNTKLAKAAQLKTWLSSPARTQELVEEKERQLRGDLTNVVTVPDMPNIKSLPNMDKLNGFSSFNKGSAGKFLQSKIDSEVKEKAAVKAKEYLPNDSSSALKKYNSKKEELAKLEKDIKQTAIKLNQVKKALQDSVNKIKKEISSLKSGPGLYAFMKNKGIASKELTTTQKILLSVNQFGLGRTWVDYSELTVKNISLGGVNIEMNPMPYYVAFAAGKVNYRFRDFILKGNNTLPDQSLWLVRTGVGQKEKNNLIFTFYNGKKSILNYTPSNNVTSVQRVLGVSAEARLALNENNYIIAEIAKSSFQNAGSPVPSSELVDKAFNFKIHNNEAYSIKLFSQYPQTDTKLTAFYKKTGENFQSFNLYPIGVNQDAYMVRVNQYLWKRKIAIDAGIRKNDFISPIAAPSFSSQTIFKSIQATVRIKKYPFVSVGYYPSSQLSLSNNNVLIENQYNTLNAISSYSYQVKKIGINTNAVYTKFYNNSSDTGFIYFNASNYTVNQSFFITPFVVQGSVSVIDQKDLHLLTIEPLVSYQYKNSVTLSGSFKWNRLNGTEDFFGGTAGLTMYLKKLGTIQLNYDKTYVPGINNILKPVDIGRASFYREF